MSDFNYLLNILVSCLFIHTTKLLPYYLITILKKVTTEGKKMEDNAFVQFSPLIEFSKLLLNNFYIFSINILHFSRNRYFSADLEILWQYL